MYCYLQVQQDEMKPRQIESFRGRILALPEGVVSGGKGGGVLLTALVTPWGGGAGALATASAVELCF